MLDNLNAQKIFPSLAFALAAWFYCPAFCESTNSHVLTIRGTNQEHEVTLRPTSQGDEQQFNSLIQRMQTGETNVLSFGDIRFSAPSHSPAYSTIRYLDFPRAALSAAGTHYVSANQVRMHRASRTSTRATAAGSFSPGVCDKSIGPVLKQSVPLA